MSKPEPKMTSTLTELETEIWRLFKTGESSMAIYEEMIIDHPDISIDAIGNLVKSIYTKDFKTE
jgi:DNA-binding CsgD family transcriptional regulator